MAIEYASITEQELCEYQRLFFERVCLLDTAGRDSFSIPLPAPLDRIHFACVQDTAERLTEETGRLSVFQWRNCLFVPIDRRVKINEVYEEVFEQLRHRHPSLFIRSYVYVIFIKVYGDNALNLDLDIPSRSISKDDLQIYAWNTNYDVKLQGKQDLFNLTGPKDSADNENRFVSNKVFIVQNPGKELDRIQDANSDVIDATRAFLGEIDLVSQTQKYLDDITEVLDDPEQAGVLLEGPARSGKTIIAMSLLSRYPNAKMLLMNWYFYDALVDAFRVWSKLDESEIKRLFATDEAVLDRIKSSERNRLVLERFRDNPRLLDTEIMMRSWDESRLHLCPSPQKRDKAVPGECLLNNIRKSEAGDFVFSYAHRSRSMQVMRIKEVIPDSSTAVATWAYPFSEGNDHCRKLDDPTSNEEQLAKLQAIKQAIDNDTIADLIANEIKGIADAIVGSSQRFFHHDLRHIEGRWIVDRRDPRKSYINHPRVLIGDGDMVICDEAQRLGNYVINEAAALGRLNGKLFLCGDDCQMLNQRGDLGMQQVLDATERDFRRFHLPDSLGIPKEIGILVRCLLGEGDIPTVNSSYEVKLILNSDEALIAEFEKDPSLKKHYALPASTGFFDRNYYPGIRRTSSPTPECTDECDDHCVHKFIPMLSPLCDPKNTGKPARKDPSRQYKFFCAEGIMPRYALSAYELISREVESIYLKIPADIDTKVLHAPLEKRDEFESWIKRHLYVLMTRAKSRLVINVENRELFDHFMQVCKQAGINPEI